MLCGHHVAHSNSSADTRALHSGKSNGLNYRLSIPSLAHRRKPPTHRYRPSHAILASPPGYSLMTGSASLVDRRKPNSPSAPAPAPTSMKRRRSSRRVEEDDCRRRGKVPRLSTQSLSSLEPFPKDVIDAGVNLFTTLRSLHQREVTRSAQKVKKREQETEPEWDPKYIRKDKKSSEPDADEDDTKPCSPTLKHDCLVVYEVVIDDRKQWIFGKIREFYNPSARYGCSVGFSRRVKHIVKRENIRILDFSARRFEEHSQVMALYPGTDSFYPATLLSRSNQTWLVRFEDEDPDELPVKEVLFQLMFKE